MRILHLSDLHLTEPFRSFEEVWSAPGAILQPGSFDFVVVSGDLSQSAREQEFADLEAFLLRSVVPLLKSEDRARIVLVPGNHDVDWSAKLGDWLPLGYTLDKEGDAFLSQLKKALRSPEQSPGLRVSISSHGHVDVLRINETQYPQRFSAVQALLDRFYVGGGTSATSRRFQPFRLTSREESEHWSAHVFPEERVAFYGFNSCHQNDRYWTGAMISPKAVEAARSHAEKHAKDCIRIAVWHHGLDSGRGRPDYLSANDVSLLYNAGFRIGFHGHTHQAAHQTFDALFANRFIVVSTGSLGAGSQERPDAVGNQFSIARVFAGHIDVEVFNRNGSANTYERNKERRRFSLESPTSPRLDQQSHAERHLRSCSVGANGITRVDVRLEKLTIRHELTLAVLMPPNVQPDSMAQTPMGPRPVRTDHLPDGRIRYSLVSKSPEESLEFVTWNYRASNELAITQMDIQVRDKYLPPHREVVPDHDGFPHSVHFPCDELVLALRFDEGLRIRLGSAQPLVLRRQDGFSQGRWEREPAEEQRGTLSQAPESGQLSLRIPSPLVDYQYVLLYRPDEPGEPFTGELTGLLDWLVAEGRDNVNADAGDSLLRVLNAAINAELKEVLGTSLHSDTEWVGYIWRPRSANLLTTFGMGPRRMWANRFDWGSGVAGHALRFSQAASWAKETKSPEESLIYRPPPQGSKGGGYTWILCLPLLASPRRAIGVISLAGFAGGGHAEQQLREHVDSLARAITQHAPLDENANTFQNRLFSAVNSAFWTVLRSHADLTPHRKKLVEGIARELEGTPERPRAKPDGASKRPTRKDSKGKSARKKPQR